MKPSALIFLILAATTFCVCAGGGETRTAAPSNGATTRPTAATKTIDATTFLLSCRSGKAGQYKGFTVKGQGIKGLGTMTIHRDGKLDSPGELVLQVTVAVLDAAEKPVPVRALSDWIKAEAAGRTLTIELRGKNLSEKPQPNVDALPIYSFSGVFNGDETTMGRLINSETHIIPVLDDSEVK